MNLTYEKIKNAFPALTKLSKLDLKAAEAVKLARLLGKVESELRYFEETRMSLFKKYGKEQNGGYEILNEKRSDFLKEYSELCNTEIELEAEKVNIKSEISIDAASVLALDGMVEFEF